MKSNFILVLLLGFLLYSAIITRAETFSFVKTQMKNVRHVRIAKGTLATAGELGHQVAILDASTGSQYCGGTLVASQWVISAAHCFEDTTASSVRIRAGSLDAFAGGVTSLVSQLTIHPQYDSNAINNDISILKLATPIAESSTIKYANIERSSVAVGTNMITSGWGLTEAGSSSRYLRKVTVPITNGNPYCSQYGSFSSTTMICAGDGSGRDACPGDSGGPLGRFVNGVFILAGVTSWGPADCGLTNSYGAYARVANYATWIDGFIPELKNRNTNSTGGGSTGGGGTTPTTSATKPPVIIIFGDAPSSMNFSVVICLGTLLVSLVLAYFM